MDILLSIIGSAVLAALLAAAYTAGPNSAANVP